MRKLSCILMVLLVVTTLVSPTHADTIFGLVNTGELFASSDGGASWTGLTTLPVSDAVGINAAASSSDLYLATRSGLLYNSTNAGLNWTVVGSVPASDVVDILIHASGLFLLTEAGVLWKSTNGGITFVAAATLTASNHVSLAADDSGNLYALTKTGEIARSNDEGATWSVVGAVTTSAAVSVRAVDSDLFVLTDTGDIACSTDAGASWIMVGTASQVHMTAMTCNGTDLIIASREGLIATSADGSSWSWVGSINQLTVTALGNDTPTATGVRPVRGPEASRFAVLSLWPNPLGPFDETFHVSFRLPERSDVIVEVFDVGGHRVTSRPAETFEGGGVERMSWRAGYLRTGVYFIRLTTQGGATASAKLSVVK